MKKDKRRRSHSSGCRLSCFAAAIRERPASSACSRVDGSVHDEAIGESVMCCERLGSLDWGRSRDEGSRSKLILSRQRSESVVLNKMYKINRQWRRETPRLVAGETSKKQAHAARSKQAGQTTLDARQPTLLRRMQAPVL